MNHLLVRASEEEWAELQNIQSFISLIMMGKVLRKDNSRDKKI